VATVVSVAYARGAVSGPTELILTGLFVLSVVIALVISSVYAATEAAARSTGRRRKKR
jgi:hypothetical protein